DEQPPRTQPISQIRDGVADTVVVEIRTIEDVRGTDEVKTPCQLRSAREDVVFNYLNRREVAQCGTHQLNLSDIHLEETSKRSQHVTCSPVPARSPIDVEPSPDDLRVQNMSPLFVEQDIPPPKRKPIALDVAVAG